jgi:hypothetical protein
MSIHSTARQEQSDVNLPWRRSVELELDEGHFACTIAFSVARTDASFDARIGSFGAPARVFAVTEMTTGQPDAND